MRSLRFPLAFVFVILALVAAGCASGPEKVEYSIEMSDFAYNPNSLEFKVGQEVTLHLTNSGALKHELMAGRNVITEDGVATGFEEDMFAYTDPTVTTSEEPDHDASHDHAGGQFMVTVPQNSGTADVTFLVTEDMVGEWEMGCFLDSGTHFQQGMIGTITVSP